MFISTLSRRLWNAPKSCFCLPAACRDKDFAFVSAEKRLWHAEGGKLGSCHGILRPNTIQQLIQAPYLMWRGDQQHKNNWSQIARGCIKPPFKGLWGRRVGGWDDWPSSVQRMGTPEPVSAGSYASLRSQQVQKEGTANQMGWTTTQINTQICRMSGRNWRMGDLRAPLKHSEINVQYYLPRDGFFWWMHPSAPCGAWTA